MTPAANLYASVISDVISNVRDAFLDESVDENVLQELKTSWTSRLERSKSIVPAASATPTFRTKTTNVDGGGVGGTGTISESMKNNFMSKAPNIDRDRERKNALSRARYQQQKSMLQHSSGGVSSFPSSKPTQSSTTSFITDPNKIVPVQITIPSQPGNPSSKPRALTVHVPAHALQQTGSTSSILQSVLTQAITAALALPESHAALFLQSEINKAFNI